MTVSISITKSEWEDTYDSFESPQRDISAFLIDWLKACSISSDIQSHDIRYVGVLFGGYVFWGRYDSIDAVFVVHCDPKSIKIEVYPWSKESSMDVDIKEDIMLTPS